LGRLSVIVPSVVGGSGGFVAGTQQVQGSRTVLNGINRTESSSTRVPIATKHTKFTSALPPLNGGR
jgi:hypothetical protein